MARKKPWAIVNKTTGDHIEFFKYASQANNYIDNHLGNSNTFRIRRLQ